MISVVYIRAKVHRKNPQKSHQGTGAKIAFTVVKFGQS